MNADVKSLVYGVIGVLGGLVVLDIFGIAEQGSLKIANKGKIGRKAVGVKESVTHAAAGLYQ